MEWRYPGQDRSGTYRGEIGSTLVEMVQTCSTEAPVRSGVLKRDANVKRGRGWPNLTWDESVKRYLKEWDIPKDLAMDRSALRLAIDVPEPWSFFLPSCLLVFLSFGFCSFISSFWVPMCFISSLPQLAWDKKALLLLSYGIRYEMRPLNWNGMSKGNGREDKG